MNKAISRVREQIRRVAETRWQEPPTVVYLFEVKPEYEIPGRRKDGTVAGTRLIRRFFHNIIRGTVTAVASVILSAASGTLANPFTRDGRVTGGANAQALDLVDAARKADTPWLVYSETHMAIVDSGYSFREPTDEDLKFVWHARKPETPEIVLGRRRLTWPDGSVFKFHLNNDEAYYLGRQRRASAEAEGFEPPVP